MEEVQDRGMVVPIESGEIINGWTYQITRQLFAPDYVIYGVHVERKDDSGEVTEGAVTRGFTSIDIAKRLIDEFRNALITNQDYRSALNNSFRYVAEAPDAQSITLGTSIWTRVKAPDSDI